MTLYDSENSVYGFTYNCKEEPLRPVICVREMGGEWTEYPALTEETTSQFKTTGDFYTYYVVKTEIELLPDTTYEYYAYDKYVEVGTETATLKTKDPKSTEFTFIHVSDSQEYPDYFGDTLKQCVGQADFLLHTGDVVEWSKYEEEWTAMLDGNFDYLS